MSIEHENTSEATNLGPASHVCDANADDIATNGQGDDGFGFLNAGAHENLKSRDKTAKALNVSVRSLQDGIKILDEGTQELVNAFSADQASVSAAVQTAAQGKDKLHVKPTAVLMDSSTADASSILVLDHAIWRGDVEVFLKSLPRQPIFDLVVTSPPYNIGKEYEKKEALGKYLAWQKRVIDEIVPRLKATGSLCWQVGNFVDNGEILPLDIEFAPIFKFHNLKMRNRIVWHFGHGLHAKRRFSGRYEVIMWYTKGDEYVFNLDAVRVPSKYPGKKHFKGPNAGQLSGNPLGKNPEDLWEIPNVKSNHAEKTGHPCQFPVGLVERLVLALTNVGDLVFDPFAGVASAGVATAVHERRFIGCEIVPEYGRIGESRLQDALDGNARYRAHDKPLYDHSQSKLSISPWSATVGTNRE